MVSMTRCLLAILICLLSVSAAGRSSFPFSDDEADAIAATIGQLRSHPSNGTLISPDVQNLLKEMKSEIRALVINELNASFSAAATVDLDQARSNVIARLTAANVVVGEVAAASSYQKPAFGHVEQLSLLKPAKNPRVVVLLFKLGLPCGSDASLNGLILTTGVWAPVFVREENSYASIDKALGDLTYDISALDQNADFLVVSTASPPSCSGNTPQSADVLLSALRVHSQPKKAEELFPDSHPAQVQKNVTSVKLISTDSDAFEVSLRVAKFLERGQAGRTRTLRFEINGLALKKTAPRTTDLTTVTDFVDDWAWLPWDEAKEWVSGVARSIIRCRHDEINRAGATGFAPQLLGGSLESCGPNATITVGLQNQRGIFYVVVGALKGVATVVSVNTTKPNCR